MDVYVPDVYQENVFTVNYELLKNKGIKCLLFDLDNTLAPYNEKTLNDTIFNLIEELKKDFKVIIFSNSPKKRVSRFGNILHVDYVYYACKPHPKKLLKTIEDNKFKESEVALIGDQIIRDVKCGNTVGVLTILTEPLSKYDQFFTKIGRIKERRIIKKLRRDNLFKGRFYDEKV